MGSRNEIDAEPRRDDAIVTGAAADESGRARGQEHRSVHRFGLATDDGPGRPIGAQPGAPAERAAELILANGDVAAAPALGRPDPRERGTAGRHPAGAPRDQIVRAPPLHRGRLVREHIAGEQPWTVGAGGRANAKLDGRFGALEARDAGPAGTVERCRQEAPGREVPVAHLPDEPPTTCRGNPTMPLDVVAR